MAQPNLLKRRLLAGEILFGAWLAAADPTGAEILATQGFDFLILDMEHGAGDLRHAVEVLRALRGLACPCVVRAPWNDAVFLKKILDLGAQSVMIPGVETAQEAQAAVRACKYPPQGTRGYAAPIVRASDYGADPDYMSAANAEILLVVQMESAASVGRAAEICAVEGVDVPFLGVNDMAGTLGLLEQLARPEVRDLVAKAETAMRASGKPYGTAPSAGADWRRLVEDGYRFLPTVSDIGLLRDAARASVAERRAYLAGRAR